MPTRSNQSYPKRVQDPRTPDDRRVLLVDGASAPIGRGLAEQLVARGMHVHSADARMTRGPSVVSHLIPATSDPGFLPALARLVRRHGIQMVIPVSSAATQELSVGKVVLGSDVEVIAPSRGSATLAHDRLLVASTLWAHAVAVPHFGVPSDFRDVDAALRLMDGEFVLRARFAGDGRTATLVRAPGDLDWAALADDSLVQQFVAGAAYAVVLHRPVNGDGRLTVVLEKTIRADGEVVTSRVKESRAVGSVERVAQAAIRALGLTGPAEVMIRSTADGSPVVLDVSAGFGPHTRMVPELIDVVLRSHRTASTDFTRECVAAESGRRQAGGRR